MSNEVPDTVRQQHVIHPQYFFAISLFFLHGYYNFVRLDGWFHGAINLLKETITIIILGPFCFSNYDASRDKKRDIAERNVRQATHAANITAVVFITIRLIWNFSVLATHNNGISDNANAFEIMNNGFWLVPLMTIAFFIRLCSLKPDTGELQFLKYILRYPWRFISPTRQNETFSGGNKRQERRS
ncbi:hypothetical protein M431DRAFT_526181 [Trichoderma harzianum CBS 226.95]|uniref:Uncharacterized protein n=1 Tax=Trichoderma harzianum CBS 226.95 TaxID=983964 RepID=A0A2T3ZR43_TRIHA|nr:hypothetical protein M431DRAFT_526181 [Trichoderma harzianum CBS 226.95]PTB47271.1 hypothetical protein M431DRAFT_526181 [Trichoderma harzianum CBS 226.95]